MGNRAKLIAGLAESKMVRDTLNRWEKFKFPEPNEKIDALLKQLEVDQEEEAGEGTNRSNEDAAST